MQLMDEVLSVKELDLISSRCALGGDAANIISVQPVALSLSDLSKAKGTV